jgi:hypothetical protein
MHPGRDRPIQTGCEQSLHRVAIALMASDSEGKTEPTGNYFGARRRQVPGQQDLERMLKMDSIAIYSA